MKERPILFSTEMVQAILADRKNVTRRMTGLESKNEHPDFWERSGDPQKFTHKFNYKKLDFSPLKIQYGFRPVEWDDNYDLSYAVCPYGQPGDLLWVRETFFDTQKYKSAPLFQFAPPIIYKADPDTFIGCHKWKPSIHMPQEASRIWLKITKIKAERLKNITEADALAEGIIKIDDEAYKYDNSIGSFQTALSAFRALWRSINGLESWDQNPWVWAISFEVVSKTGRPCN
jgi:hypothetical protein